MRYGKNIFYMGSFFDVRLPFWLILASGRVCSVVIKLLTYQWHPPVGCRYVDVQYFKINGKKLRRSAMLTKPITKRLEGS